MRVKGLEPPRREALDPKSSVSTNFTTPADDELSMIDGAKVQHFFKLASFLSIFFLNLVVSPKSLVIRCEPHVQRCKALLTNDYRLTTID